MSGGVGGRVQVEEGPEMEFRLASLAAGFLTSQGPFLVGSPGFRDPWYKRRISTLLIYLQIISEISKEIVKITISNDEVKL